jgi:hypothetical protein
MRPLPCSSVFLLAIFLCAFCAQSAGAQNAALDSPAHDATSDSQEEVAIPGPLRSFLRMAAISQKATPEEVLPLLARNVSVSGYVERKPTEFMILLSSYLRQARELEALAGKHGVIEVSNCDDVKPLLVILGYRLRQDCGPNAALETADASRAFLTIDSGFPLAELEETLRGGQPLEVPYSATNVPVLFKTRDWVVNEKYANRSVLDSILRDSAIARLYWGLSRMDTQTAHFLWQSLGPKNLVSRGAALDFFGGQISVRSGAVVVPGGRDSESAWKDLVGANPKSPAEFVSKLLARDSGWLAAYFDALSRANATQQSYFTAPQRLQRFYEALRGKDINPIPTRHSFRPDVGMFLLIARLPLDSSSQPLVPGNLEVWKEVMRHATNSKLEQEWGKRAAGWNNSDQLIEGLFGVSRKHSREGPLAAFLAVSEIDRGRPKEHRLSPETARLLAEKFARFGDQYSIFAEFHELSDDSISRFFATAENLDQIQDLLVRTDALGALQANMGLWQILARQGEIDGARLNDSWQQVIHPFAAVRSSAQIFEATKASLAELLSAAIGKSALSQDQFLALLAGPEQRSREGQQLRTEIAGRMRQVLEDQRLVSLDTLLALGEGLNQMAKGKEVSESLLSLAGELREFEMPKPLFTSRERNDLVSGLYSNRHTILQMKTDLTRVIKASSSPAELLEARGLLTPFLRDTLVGINYAYYEPPGAQMLHHNPLFVRSHDFSGGDYSGEVSSAREETWRSPRLFGRGWTASGGAHLMGSLADLPYVLAQVEQDFIAPQNVQSLIWEDMAPVLITSAVLPRWWGVTPNELHAVALYQRAGEELLVSSLKDDTMRQEIVNILSERMLPQRVENLEAALRSARPEDVMNLVVPAEAFYVAAEFRHRHPGESEKWGTSGKELDDLLERYPEQTNWRRLSEDFGVPHPALALNYGRELMNLKPMPTFQDYSSRLLAESWDSSNLYWARLADEMGYSPMLLNQLVPQLTRRMIELTFASHLEDWPAVLRAMRETGEEFRQGKIAALPRTSPASKL